MIYQNYDQQYYDFNKFGYFAMKYLIKPTLNRRYNDAKMAIKQHISIDKVHTLNEIKQSAQQLDQEIKNVKNEINDQLNQLPIEQQTNQDQNQTINQNENEQFQLNIQTQQRDYQLEIQQLKIQFDYIIDNYNKRLQKYNERKQIYDNQYSFKQAQITKKTTEIQFLAFKLNSISFISQLSLQQLQEDNCYIIINSNQQQIKLQIDNQKQIQVDRENSIYKYTMFIDEILIQPYSYQNQIEFVTNQSSTDVAIYVQQSQILEQNCIHIHQDSDLQIFNKSGKRIIIDDQQIDKNQIYVYDVDFNIYASDTEMLLKQTLLYNQRKVTTNKLYQQNQLILEKSQKYNVQMKQNSTQTENIQISQNIVEKQNILFDQENNNYYRKIDNYDKQNIQQQQQIQQIIQQQNDNQYNLLTSIQQPRVQFTKIQLQNLQNIEEIQDLKLLYQQQQYNLQGGLVLLNNFECTQPITINISSYILDDFTLVINNKILITFPPNFILNQQNFRQSTIDQQTNIVIDVQGIVTPKVQNPQSYLIFNNDQFINNVNDQNNEYYNIQQNNNQINNKNTTYIVDNLIKKQDKQISLQDNINEVKDTTQKLVDEIQAQKAILQKFVKNSKCIDNSTNNSINNINKENTDSQQNIINEEPVDLNNDDINNSIIKYSNSDNMQQKVKIENNQSNNSKINIQNKNDTNTDIVQVNNQDMNQKDQEVQKIEKINSQQNNINQEDAQNNIQQQSNNSCIDLQINQNIDKQTELEDIENAQQQNIKQDNSTSVQSINNNTNNFNNTDMMVESKSDTIDTKMKKLNQILDDVLQSSDSANVSVGFSPILLERLKQQIQLSSESSNEEEIKIKKETEDKIDQITKNKLWLKKQAQKIYDDSE